MQRDRPGENEAADPTHTAMSESHTFQLTRSFTKRIKRRFTLPRSAGSQSEIPSALSSPSSQSFPRQHSVSVSDSGSTTSDRLSLDFVEFYDSEMPRNRALSASQQPPRSMNSSSTSVHQFDESYTTSHDLTRSMSSATSSLPSTPRIIQDPSFFDEEPYSPFTTPDRVYRSENEDSQADEIANRILEKVNSTFPNSNKDGIWWGL